MDGVGLAAFGADLRHGLFVACIVDICADAHAAVAGKFQRDAAVQSRTGPCDEGDIAFQSIADYTHGEPPELA